MHTHRSKYSAVDDIKWRQIGPVSWTRKWDDNRPVMCFIDTWYSEILKSKISQYFCGCSPHWSFHVRKPSDQLSGNNPYWVSEHPILFVWRWNIFHHKFKLGNFKCAEKSMRLCMESLRQSIRHCVKWKMQKTASNIVCSVSESIKWLLLAHFVSEVVRVCQNYPAVHWT